MRVTAYLQAQRTYLPCTGVGRHANGILLALARRDDVELTIACASEHLGPDGRLPRESPLRDLPIAHLPWPEKTAELLWKLAGFPKLDSRTPPQSDWIISPTEISLPTRRTPVAITIHDARMFEPEDAFEHDDASNMGLKRMAWWLSRAARRADLVATVSEFSRRRLVDLLGLEPDRVVVIGNGIADYFISRAQTSQLQRTLPTTKPYVLTIGGLRPLKGGSVVLSVARMLMDQGSPIEIRVAGEPSDSTLLRQAKKLQNVKLLGMLTDDQLQTELSNARVFFFPSAYEGFGIPALEAMALGVPVVGSNRAALPEVAGAAARLFPMEDHRSMLQAILALAQDDDSRRRQVAVGRKHAMQFDWAGPAEKLVAALRTAAPRQRRARFLQRPVQSRGC